jgi:beta-glucanase (GH16 family)
MVTSLPDRLGRWRPAALSAGLALTLGASGKDEAAVPQTECPLRPVMIEDFNELSVAPNTFGPARWTAHTPWSGDFGDAVFIDPEPGRPFKVNDGLLSITAAKREDGRWTSGLLAAADASGNGAGARYGYFEARMKMPPGSGVWPAFWLAALKPVATSDANVEIDVVEYYGQFPFAFRSTVHAWYKDQVRTRAKGERIDVPSGVLVDKFHAYGVDISPQAIRFYLDGAEVWNHPTPPELTSPMYPIVNLALGGGWPIDQTPDPSVLLVDYVHVYERDAGPPQGCRPGPPRKAGKGRGAPKPSP